MASFGKKKTITDYLYSKPVIAVLLVIAIFMSIAVYHRFTVEREMALRRAEMEKERVELIQRKAELEERVDYLSGDRGIEEEIRKHFDVAKEGEQVVIIVDKGEEQKPEIPPILEKKPWYLFWVKEE
jgi:cell division protein FtsB